MIWNICWIKLTFYKNKKQVMHLPAFPYYTNRLLLLFPGGNAKWQVKRAKADKAGQDKNGRQDQADNCQCAADLVCKV